MIKLEQVVCYVHIPKRLFQAFNHFPMHGCFVTIEQSGLCQNSGGGAQTSDERRSN